MSTRLYTRRPLDHLARGLERAVHDAEHRPAGISARVPVNARAVHENRAALLALADELRACGDPGRRGVAEARALLADGGGPLYTKGEFGDLKAAVFRARAALST